MQHEEEAPKKKITLLHKLVGLLAGTNIGYGVDSGYTNEDIRKDIMEIREDMATVAERSRVIPDHEQRIRELEKKTRERRRK